ncbi:RHS repeat-associated core domain-containing protein [Paraglaciecola sp.]|uniref:RHS repeat-associated core domain-containing protein n=1 Tax=Paraglaciecola sp. TaxID=1920173 RepID=UPI0032677454
MNGRIYDPTLGRFLQADPLIQAPKNSQSYNRYSYVFNNPMSYTDPSGYSAWTKFRDKILKPIAVIVISVYLPGSTAIWGAAAGGFGATVATGALAGYVATGSLKGALTGAFTAGVFYGVGSAFGNADVAFGSAKHFGKVLAHGMTGGVMSVLQGGKFGHGFASAGMAQFAAPGIDGIDSTTSGISAQRVIAAAVIGGTTSVITGGKFANGAVTGAFSRAFNDELHYNGKKLTWKDDDGNTVKEWDAASGRPGSTTADQDEVDYGPIPEGDYLLEQDQLQNWADVPGGDKLLSLIGRGPWPGGTGSWGEHRVWATPVAGTETFGRSGFSVHGGSTAGSAGCVDLTIHMNSFTNQFNTYFEQNPFRQNIPLKVDY